jgi:hypothetical protein
MKAVIMVGLVAAALAFVPRIVISMMPEVQVAPYVPGWKTHESQSRGISEEYASRWDRNLHERVCEAQ